LTKGGLDFGTVGSSLVLLAVLVALVVLATVYNSQKKPRENQPQLASLGDS
jgi:uncharacterized membrane-anchored protein